MASSQAKAADRKPGGLRYQLDRREVSRERIGARAALGIRHPRAADEEGNGSQGET
jgi:hypothetical protein